MRLADWKTDDELVGKPVLIYTDHGSDPELATVLGVHPNSYTLRVRSHEDGEILIGNQWEDAD